MEQHWTLTFEAASLEAEFLAERKDRMLFGLRRLALLTFSGLSMGWIVWLASGKGVHHPVQVCVLALVYALSFFGILLTWRTECNSSFGGSVLEYIAIVSAVIFQISAILHDSYYSQKLEGMAPLGYYSDTRILMMLIISMMMLRLLIPVRWSRLLFGDLLCNLVYMAFALAFESPEGVTLVIVNVVILAIATCGLSIGHRQLEQSERLRFVAVVEADATLLKQNSELMQRGQLVSKLVGSLCDATVVLQNNFEIIEASASFAEMMATPKDEVLGRNFLGYIHSSADRAYLEHTATRIALGSRFEGNGGFDDSCSFSLMHMVLEDALSQTCSIDLHLVVFGVAEPMILGIKRSSERRSSTASPELGDLPSDMLSRASNRRVGNATAANLGRTVPPLNEGKVELDMIQVQVDSRDTDNGTSMPASTIIGKSSASQPSTSSEPLSPVPDRLEQGSPQPIDGLWTAEENSPVNAPQTMRINRGRAWLNKSSMKLTLSDDGTYRSDANDKGYFALDEMGLLHVVSGSGQAVLYRRAMPMISDAV
eukprot:TRINITY_DN9492_c0_g1_i1.p1 TRINITY_DN9492_c0_g1~~TRINITY_DN9492_c0_g1_i1.p1  ORF type:complete len:540 (+),score=66.51 TRINITY_DN9492_c0_g1_i1:78-1697(+)